MVKMIPCRGLILALVLALVFSSFSICGQAQSPVPEDPHLRDAVENGISRFAAFPSLAAPVAVQSAAAARLPWSKVVFQSYRDNNYEIYIADDDGGSLARLTNNSKTDIQPRLNRGGTKIAYASNTPGTFDIYSMNPNGTGVTRLTNNTKDDTNPLWSPDSSKIVFQSYRDNNWEIYVMNANGTNQTRLTNNSGYDGEPSWSPDGTKIVWSAYRNGQYSIWIMNANGTGAAQLSNQTWSEDAMFSPDGSQIAYDADGNGDSWYEVWLMNADGSNQHLVYATPSGSAQDVFVRGWSPDGNWISYTHVYDIYYNGKWYWTDAFLKMVSPTAVPAVETDLLGTNMDWLPDWQTLDTQAPASSVQALPAQTPGPFTVSWNVSDSGGAGIKYLEIQAKDGAGGLWTSWQTTTTSGSASYPGIGGHTYYFRSRAADNSWNVEAWPADYDAVTVVEALAPVSRVLPLPEFIMENYMGSNVQVSWTGSDQGGSGIAKFDVQSRDVPADWVNWLTNTTSTSEQFSGETGHTYCFRVRATDFAQNLESQHSDQGDACTSFYSWTIQGVASDMRGLPVVNVNTVINRPTMTNLPSDIYGRFFARGGVGTNFSVSWAKDGYGLIPNTLFGFWNNITQDAFLPPVDNLVLNSNFEQETLENWTLGGETQPAVSSEKHTGEKSAFVGNAQPLFPPAINLSNDIFQSEGQSIVVDSADNVHLIWQTDQGNLRYAHRSANGDWAPVLDLFPCGGAALAIDHADNLHVACFYNGTLYYLRRDAASGTWSNADSVASGSGAAILAVGDNDSLHLVWQAMINGAAEIMYALRSPNGSWSTPFNVSNDLGNSQYESMVQDKDGNIHVAWSDNTPGNYEIYYSCRKTDGEWLSPARLTVTAPDTLRPHVFVGNNGVVHLIWQEGWSSDFLYSNSSIEGVWSAPVTITHMKREAEFQKVMADSNGTFYILWHDGDLSFSPDYYLLSLDPSGAWSTVEIPALHAAYSSEMFVEPNGTLHFAFGGYSPLQEGYVRREINGTWSSVQKNVKGQSQKMAIDSKGIVHIVWQEYGWSTTDIFYTSANFPSQPEDSTLSQTITLPAGMGAATLSFLHDITDATGVGGPTFEVSVIEGSTRTPVFSANLNTGGWKHAWADLSPWSGRTITLQFNMHEVSNRPYGGVYLDEITVGNAGTDIWINPTYPITAFPGQQVTFTTRYANRSTVLAKNVTLTQTLAPQLTFVSADPAPTSIVGQVLTWDIGDLAGSSGPFTIQVTVTVAEDTALLSTLNGSVQIQTTSAELELANNTVPTRLFIGTKTYIPLIHK